MDKIFHEKQEGSLCAQHCLNALLQGPYFTAVDLGTLAQSLDDEERIRMAESGIESEEYQRFLTMGPFPYRAKVISLIEFPLLQQPSGNMDDSGYFSVQVISRALQVWSLDLVPYNSSCDIAVIAQRAPESMSAFICNYRDHWFTIRKLGVQWFNLNSLLSKPTLISDTYLSLFLAQLQKEGYSIFIVRGSLPDCPADLALRLQPYIPLARNQQDSSRMRTASATSDDEELKAALALSLSEQDQDIPRELQREISSEDEELQAALALSLGVQKQQVQEKHSVEKDIDEEEQLRAALALSLGVQEREERPVDPEEIRRRRLAFLDSAKSS